MSKPLQKAQNQVISKIKKEEEGETEDVVLAFQLLNKYKKDKNFIERDIKEQKRQTKLIVREDEPEKKKYQPRFDPVLTQEERHRQIAEKREQRKL